MQKKSLHTYSINSHAMTKRLSRNTLALLLSNAGSALLSFGLSALIGRVLGQDGLGVYAATLAWVFPLALAADFGLGTLLTRDLAQKPALESDYLRQTTATRLWLGGGLMVILIALAPLLSRDSTIITGLRISAPLVMIMPFFGAFTAVFRARQIMWPIPPLNLGMLIVQLILTIIIFAGGGGVLAALALNTLTSAGQLVAAWYVWKFIVKPAATVDEAHHTRVQWRLLIRRAWPFALAGVLAALQARVGTILLERFTDTSQIGYYTASVRFVEAGRVLPNALFGALLPALAALSAQPAAMRQTFRRTLIGLAVFGGLLGLFFSMVGGMILNFTYGADFTPAESALQIGMWGLIPALLRAGYTLYWYALGRERLTNIATGVSLIGQIGLSFWLIPRYGAAGAALAVAAGEMIALALLWRGQS